MNAPLSRRTVLRGLGTALALPWLEATLSARETSPAAPPLRLAFLYVPNGAHMPDWTPAAEGRQFELPYLLEPLEPYRKELLVLSGLTHDKARANGDGPGDHARAASVFLTGVQPLKPNGQVRAGVSVDQLAADSLGTATRFRSLELGCEAGRQSGECDSGYACAYSNNISWRTPTTPAAKETNPRLVFERLFRDGEDGASAAARAERQEKKRSVLDFVRADARRLERKLGTADRRILDDYFSGLRELERRVRVGARDLHAHKHVLLRFARVGDGVVEPANGKVDLQRAPDGIVHVADNAVAIGPLLLRIRSAV